ncbi:hypothetical protein [Geodermatophilus sp. DSM 45219]|nr:hypothetical protein [Geodermatophilus sp. DSM 45219]SDN70503.1 hypothetical protein SAMN05428965_1234 [Geodermatophilus sp. DSM 45219]
MSAPSSRSHRSRLLRPLVAALALPACGGGAAEETAAAVDDAGYRVG